MTAVLPMRIWLLSPVTPATLAPRVMLFVSPPVYEDPVLCPTATLFAPVVLRERAPAPSAVLESFWLRASALYPIAVLELPETLVRRALTPTPTLKLPERLP